MNYYKIIHSFVIPVLNAVYAQKGLQQITEQSNATYADHGFILNATSLTRRNKKGIKTMNS